MRLWSLHPRYLDRQGLTACWREALLAQAVLAGRTTGYRSHPQLRRFAATPDPVAVVGAYLAVVADEADSRGYRYDRSRILRVPVEGTDWSGSLTVSRGQILHEWQHLTGKLARRSPDWLTAVSPKSPAHACTVDPHPVFRVVEGPVAEWEVVQDQG